MIGISKKYVSLLYQLLMENDVLKMKLKVYLGVDNKKRLEK